MNKLSILSALIVIASGIVPLQASAFSLPAPDVHYDFEGDLEPQVAGSVLTPEPSCADTSRPHTPCNSSASFGSDSAGGYWTWDSSNPRGGGFTISTPSAIGDTYTIAVRFSFSQISGYRKIVDYLNRASDTGFYVLGGRINFYPLGTGTTTFAENEVLDLVAVRQSISGLSGQFTVYLNSNGTLTELLSVTDTQGTSIPFVDPDGKTILGFFYDDNATSAEGSASGKVWDLKIWGGQALSDTQVRNITAASQLAGAPQVSSAPALTGSAIPGQVLQASEGTWSGTGNTFSYQWYTCTAAVSSVLLAVPATCSPISGATSQTYTVAGDENHILAAVTATNLIDDSVAVVPSILVGSVPSPSVTQNPIITGAASIGGTLSVSDGTWSGSGVTYDYAWYDCTAAVPAGEATPPAGCTLIPNATSAQYQPNGNESNLVAFVTATNSGGSATVSSASVVLTSEAPSPQPYVGPVVASSVVSNGKLHLSGNLLDSVSRIEIAGQVTAFTRASAGQLTIEIPTGLAAGEYDVILHSSFGRMTVQGAFRIGSETLAPQTLRKAWTKLSASGGSIKFYSKNPVGEGKVQFFANGRELAWIRAIDGADPKLSLVSGSAYFVRTFELRPGKNRLEIRADGSRVWRATYVPKN